jgi:inositol transport system substrate-binding protein
MAEALEKKFPNGAKFIFLDGEPGSGSAVLRAKGFFGAIEKDKDKYKIVARQTAKWQRPEGLRVTQNILTSLGYQPDAIVSANDDMALGAIEALRTEKIVEGKVAVIGRAECCERWMDVRYGRSTSRRPSTHRPRRDDCVLAR